MSDGARPSSPSTFAPEQRDILTRRRDIPDGIDRVEELYLRYEPSLRRFLAAILQDASLAEEVCQETFRRALSSLSSGTALRDPRAWLYTVAAREASRRRRRRYLGRGLARFLPSVDGSGFETNVQERDRIQRALGELPEDQRLALLLHVLEGFRYREIAQMLDATEGAVKMKMLRAKQRMRELLK